MAGAALVDDRQRGIVHLLGEGPGPRHAPNVRRHHHHISQILGGEVVHQHGRAVDVIAGDIEIALNLGGVQVHCQHAVHARRHQQVGRELGGDRFTTGSLAIRSGVAVVRHHRGDLPCGGPSAGIHHDQQLHQVIVHRCAGGLDQEHVAATDRLLDLHVELTVGKTLADAGTIRHPEISGNLLGQSRVRGAAEQAQTATVRGHLLLFGTGCCQETCHGARGTNSAVIRW